MFLAVEHGIRNKAPVILGNCIIHVHTLFGCVRLPVSCLSSTLFSVPRPHLSFEPQLVGGKSHDFGPLTCPEPPDPPASATGIAYGKQKHEAELKYPQRIRRLNIFPASKTEVILLY